MHSTAAATCKIVFLFILNIEPTSNNIFDLIFFPPGRSPYNIGLIRSVFFSLEKYR